MKEKIKPFSKDEITLINEFGAEVPFRVLQTTNETDLKVLRTVCDLAETNNLDLAHLIQRMHATVTSEQSKGVGIAAPQVGINRQVILVQRVDKDRDFEYFINPKIIWKSEILREGDEGCLSIPDAYQPVKRSLLVTIQFQNLEGKTRTETVEGFAAVIFQHEIDHLNGVLFTDYLEEQATTEFQPASEIHALYYKK